MVVFIGRSYGDGIRPSSVKSLAGAAEGGARVVIVDPRLNNTGVFATDWVPIRPGADIAFLLGIANVLVTRDLYDHAFVEQSAVGFPEFAAQVTEYTPEWAEGICDVPAIPSWKSPSRWPPPHRPALSSLPGGSVRLRLSKLLRDGSRGVRRECASWLLGAEGRSAHHLFAQGGRRGSGEVPRGAQAGRQAFGRRRVPAGALGHRAPTWLC